MHIFLVCILHIVRSLNYILFPYHKSMSAHVVTECKKFKKIHKVATIGTTGILCPMRRVN